MAKEKKAAAREEKRAAADYYRLNTQAVDDLVNANEENSPPVSEEELRKYQSGPKFKLSDTLKALLIKFWFAGAVCFFFMWGLGFYLQNQIDQIFLVSVAWGAITDLLTNNVFRFLEKTPGASNRHLMVTKEGIPGLLLNLLYGFLVMFCVVTTYHGVNVALMFITGAEGMVLGVEPILFGLFTTAWDTLFIKMKTTLRQMVQSAKAQAKR